MPFFWSQAPKQKGQRKATEVKREAQIEGEGAGVLKDKEATVSTTPQNFKEILLRADKGYYCLPPQLRNQKQDNRVPWEKVKVKGKVNI